MPSKPRSSSEVSLFFKTGLEGFITRQTSERTVDEFISEIHSYRESQLISDGKSESLQRLYGIYYTDLSLSKILMSDCHRMLDGKQGITFLEPCVGLGSFLISHLEIMMGTQPEAWRSNLDKALKNSYVADIDEEAIKNIPGIIAKYFKYKYGLEAVLPEDNLIVSDSINPDSGGGYLDKLSNQLGGFDIVASNPPYRLLKPNPKLNDQQKTSLEKYLKLLRSHGVFRLQSGTWNIYKLFVEKMINWTGDKGVLGLLVPRSLLTDYQSTRLRLYLLREFSLERIYEIPEKNQFFLNVGQAFSMFSAKKGESTRTFSYEILESNLKRSIAPIQNIEDEDLQVGAPLLPMTVEEIKWKSMMRSQTKLKDIVQVVNMRGEIDITIDNGLISEIPTLHPFVRGANIKRYGLVPPEEWILENGLKTKEKSRWALKPRLACQQISNSSQHIRLKWSLIPAGYALGNSCNFVTLDDNLFPVPDHYLYFLLGVLNSSLVNMHFKLFSSNNHISNSEIGLLPIPKVSLEIEKNISRLAKSLTLKYSSKLDQELDSLVHKAFGDH